MHFLQHTKNPMFLFETSQVQIFKFVGALDFFNKKIHFIVK